MGPLANAKWSKTHLLREDISGLDFQLEPRRATCLFVGFRAAAPAGGCVDVVVNGATRYRSQLVVIEIVG